MKLILILRSENKQKADSPCEEIRISGEIEKLKLRPKLRPKRTERSVPKNAKRSLPK